SPAPPWWPPAPGWWMLAAAVMLVLAATIAWRWWGARRRRRLQALFDAEVDAAAGPAASVAAISGLLRRAARLRDPAADRLQGQAWLAFPDAGRGATRFDGARGTLVGVRPFRRAGDVAGV